MAHILKEFDFEALEGHEVVVDKYEVPMHPVNGVKIVLKARGK